MIRYPLVEVVWVDAAAHLGWELEGYADPAGSTCLTVTSVGYLIRKTTKDVVLAMTCAEDGKLAGWWSIPRSEVTRVTVLRKGKA